MVKQLSKEEYECAEWWKATAAWIERIPEELDSKKGAKPLQCWRVFQGDTRDAAFDAAWDAAFDAAWDATQAAAWDAAWDAAWNAAWNATQAAAWNATQAAAWNAARDAAWNAAWDAAWKTDPDAAWDTALFAVVKVCAGLPIDRKHVKHAEERWEANKRGYRVLCDVNGVLYVYRKKG